MLATAVDECVCLQEIFNRNMVDSDSSYLLQTGCREEAVLDFAGSVSDGLHRHPRQLDCRYLYDANGSALFEDICRQPEYYQTRTERSILAANADNIRAVTGPVLLFELGAGCACKTGCLLDAYVHGDGRLTYAPVDVSESALRQAGVNINGKWPDVQVLGIHGTYQDAFPLFTMNDRAMVIFLGSTIGNFDDDQADEFWRSVSIHMKQDDYFLLGVDLVKDIALLEAAYNDAAGVTEAFTKNLFRRMNRELGSEIHLDHVEHVARYCEELKRIEIFARFHRQQPVRIKPLCREFIIRQGEEILVEISRKFELSELPGYFRQYGFSVEQTYTDPNDWFGLLLLRKDGIHAFTS